MDPIERFRMLRDDAAWDDEDLYVSPHPSARAALGGLGAVGSGGGRTRWWAWAVPSLVVAAALAALAVFSLGGVLSLGHGGGPAGAPGVMSGTATAIPDIRGAKRCAADQLEASTVAVSRSLVDHIDYAAVQLKNVSNDNCVLQGTPREVALDSAVAGGGVTSMLKTGPLEGEPGYLVEVLSLHAGDVAYLPIGLEQYLGAVSANCLAGPLPAEITLPDGGVVDVPTVTDNGCHAHYTGVIVWPYTSSPELSSERLQLPGSSETLQPTALPDPSSTFLDDTAEKARERGIEQGRTNTPVPTPDCNTVAVTVGSWAVTPKPSNYYALVAISNGGDYACRLPVSPVTAFVSLDGSTLRAFSWPGADTQQGKVLKPGGILYFPVGLISAGGTGACSTGEIRARVVLSDGVIITAGPIMPAGTCHPPLADFGGKVWPGEATGDLSAAALGVPSLQNPGLDFGVGG